LVGQNFLFITRSKERKNAQSEKKTQKMYRRSLFCRTTEVENRI